MVFKTYYYIQDSLKSLIKRYMDLHWKVGDVATSVAAKVATNTRFNSHSVFPYEICKPVTIYYPEQIRDICIAQIPLITTTGLFQLSLMYAFTDNAFLDMLNVRLSEEFLDDNRAQFDCFMSEYELRLSQAITELENILEGRDTPIAWLQEFIKDRGFVTTLELPSLAELSGFTKKELELALKVLVNKGVVRKTKPEVYEWRG